GTGIREAVWGQEVFDRRRRCRQLVVGRDRNRAWATVKIASAPHSGLSVARHLGARPPPHSSVNSSLVPSLLNVAECQNAKFESATAARRRGWAGSRMSSSKPYPAHAPPATPSAG